jgi:hypothetical protein
VREGGVCGDGLLLGERLRERDRRREALGGRDGCLTGISGRPQVALAPPAPRDQAQEHAGQPLHPPDVRGPEGLLEERTGAAPVAAFLGDAGLLDEGGDPPRVAGVEPLMCGIAPIR